MLEECTYLLKTIVVDRLIVDENEFLEPNYSVSVLKEVTLNAIDFWQIVTSPVSVFEIYNS